MHRKLPHVRFRIVRTLHAICMHCGTRYTYRDAERTFVVEQPAARERFTSPTMAH